MIRRFTLILITLALACAVAAAQSFPKPRIEDPCLPASPVLVCESEVFDRCEWTKDGIICTVYIEEVCRLVPGAGCGQNETNRTRPIGCVLCVLLNKFEQLE